MRFGIYYAYWEKEWNSNYFPYISKARKLGFDILEVACGSLIEWPDNNCRLLTKTAIDDGICLTGGYGPRPEHDLSSSDENTVNRAFQFYKETFRKMELASIYSLGGALYSYWPTTDAPYRDKEADMARSIRNMQRLSAMAADYGITLNMEALNRFEGYLINTCAECVAYVKAVDRSNVRVMLDTFHMNIEEDSLQGAILEAKDLLGHFHVGEANRKPPNDKGRMPWAEIGVALKEIGYNGDIVMEPFVCKGGQVGRDVALWRDLSEGATQEQLDRDAADSVAFLRGIFA